ncbi:telomere-protecting terminal protein Tpg [Streptomyces sp. NPDC127051]|uniref:telomere-protecting terminal protein Tpg n=1 Tax=Streptomyces sp. NPDC127051 TaxID=3347119 RepID=UPI00364DE402
MAMSNDNTAGCGLLRGKLLDGLRRAERALFTCPAPKSAQARMKFLRTREGGSSRSLAERLGVSRKTVDRYLSGATKTPQKRLQAVLEQETEAEWQPQVRARARQRAAASAGARHLDHRLLRSRPCGHLGRGPPTRHQRRRHAFPRRRDPRRQGQRRDGQ